MIQNCLLNCNFRAIRLRRRIILAGEERRLLAAEAAESCLEKKAARSASFAEKARQDRSEVPADHVKFVKNGACTALARHLSKPTAKGGCLPDRGKAAFENGCRWAQQMPKKLPPTSKKREGGNSQNYFDSFGDLMGREGGRAEHWHTVIEVCAISLLLHQAFAAASRHKLRATSRFSLLPTNTCSENAYPTS